MSVAVTHHIDLVECPRDAMQGWKTFIPTDKKVAYLNSLLKVGFHTIDFGSFVSSKAIPQMSDTRDVIKQLDISGSTSKLLAIVANVRGAAEASEYEIIDCLGFPFSISETFQQRNTNSSMEQSLGTVEEIRNLCSKKGKELVIYISMGFGNPYGDPYNEEIVYHWAKNFAGMDIKIISLADTVGVADPSQITIITNYLVDALPGTKIGVHLHSRMENWKVKLEAAVNSGCRRIDGALKGIGGCPMADDVLVGNMNTEWMISYLDDLQLLPPLDIKALERSLQLAEEIFK